MTQWLVTGTVPLKKPNTKSDHYQPGDRFTADRTEESIDFWERIGAITEVGKTPLGTVAPAPVVEVPAEPLVSEDLPTDTGRKEDTTGRRLRQIRKEP